ncbi:MAG: 3-deoxy-7-phosphoheptulonate synthase [Phycisphaerales bacterium]|nr:3-deoxy-7-phosphoheptulonate synthase [Phycisphaerales bacterium]
MQPWSPTSWQSKPVTQQPVYPDPGELREALNQLSCLPPLVSSFEIESLKSQLAEAARGQRFLLQGGDCAESFEDCQSTTIASKLKILLQMSLVLVHGLRKRVTRVGRFAGQYAKPRSNDIEHRADREGEPATALPAYRGDLINRVEFTADARTPDPQLLLRGYERAALTLNFIRALIDGGFADLHHPEYWDLEFVKHSPRAAEYQRIVESIGQSLRFMETLAGQTVGEMTRVDFFTSHEGLHLLYEQAQTRQVPRREGWYNLSTHMPWIGMRTATPEGAHVEYFRGIRNPIAVKIGPTVPAGSDSIADHLRKLLDLLLPNNEPGRLTIIHRFGVRDIARLLPAVIEAVGKSGKTVLWCCDPMHGNTHTVNVQTSKRPNVQTGRLGASTEALALTTQDAALSVKTRKFDDILSELEQAFDIHAKMGTYLGGVHFELTGENVTECTGGARGTSEADLTRAYKSQVDPRLNYEQALEMAMHIARRAG